MSVAFLNGKVSLHAGDCLEVIRALPSESVDSVVTDPPYALVSIQKRWGKPGGAPSKSKDAYKRASAGFMGKQWDTGEVAFAVEFWAEVLRVLKPGGHVAAFSGTRTYHRLACAIEDAGFEIRDQLAWAYGTGFPKSLDVSKAIDKAAGAKGAYGDAKTEAHRRYIEKGELRGDRGHDGWQRPWMDDPEAVANAGRTYLPATDAAKHWQGWGSALKPAWEPICLARKPLIGTVAENVLRYGTGALNIDACRVGTDGNRPLRGARRNLESDENRNAYGKGLAGSAAIGETSMGRHPANLLHDGSSEVVEAFPDAPGQQRYTGPEFGAKDSVNCFGDYGPIKAAHPRGDSGSAARFFYSAKADSDDRLGSKHPTVKPVDLMQWLCRLITPPGGVVLDCFAGTGATGAAAFREGFSAILIEREPEYQADIARRMALELAGPDERKRESLKAKGLVAADPGPLFGGAA